MYKIKILDLEFLDFYDNTYIYKLTTKFNKIILKISEADIEKETLIKYIKCPFFLISYKTVTEIINVDDYFEVSTCESTIDMECNTSCGIGN